MPDSLVRPSLADVVVRQGLVDRQAVDEVLRRLNQVPATLGQTLVAEGLLSEDQLAQALATRYDLPYDALVDFRVDPRYFEAMSVKLMQRVPFVPIAEH